MLDRIEADDWKIVEAGFTPEYQRFSESIFSLGNEHMGLRGFFEKDYSGDSLRGTYVAGIYYPDVTRVGWWKIGYPEFYAKVINSTNWVGFHISLNGEPFDLARGEVKNFRRELDMRTGVLQRRLIWSDGNGRATECFFSRFLSMADPFTACITVELTPLNYSARIGVTSYLDGNVHNEDANFGEIFWDEVERRINKKAALLTMKTKKTGFRLAAAMTVSYERDGSEIEVSAELLEDPGWVGYTTELVAEKGRTLKLVKVVSIVTSRDTAIEAVSETALKKLEDAFNKGWTELYDDHIKIMSRKWDENDLIIHGDVKAQQGIRYCIFQLNQTYAGRDARLNIGPKGFTGEKYGGATYWDTEAFCFPFYLYNNVEVARNLLLYRYNHLARAKENARKQGLKGALYPMVTVDGRECHNEWEITLEEIHRNGAIAYAIYNYTRYTGDDSYLLEYGIPVLVEISRFWADRVTYNERKQSYMLLGVTGPNEYENNVNNNWYTNTMAAWTLKYTLGSLEILRSKDGEKHRLVVESLGISDDETGCWRDIVERMYYPHVEELVIFEQNDLYMDKEQALVSDIDPYDIPLNKHWSWDRILRSCYIKQADVIQGIYFFPESYDLETSRINFDYYEPRTVHESSLSASVYSIVASRIGYKEKAYELYLRTARLDLNNYNDDTEEGIHITSMAGSWLAIVQGFAGVTVKGGLLSISPYVPRKWDGYAFKITFRGRRLKIEVSKRHVEMTQLSGAPLELLVFGDRCHCRTGITQRAALR